MRRLIRWAAYLYPAAWRRRYAREFEALLEDANPRWTDVANVLAGALKTQLTQGGSWKIAAGFALSGLLVAVVWGWFLLPDRHQVSGTFTMPAAASPVQSRGRAMRLQQDLLSRVTLAQVIQKQDLYRSERFSKPLADVIEHMRSDITIQIASPEAFTIRFQYPERVAARSTVDDLAARLQSEGGLKVLSISERQVGRPRFMIAFTGLCVGLFTGMLIASMRRFVRRTIVIAGSCGAAGLLIAGTCSFLLPETYISDLVLRVPLSGRVGLESLSREALISTIETHNLYSDRFHRGSTDQLVNSMRKSLRVTEIAEPGTGDAVLHVSFQYYEKHLTQDVLQDVLTRYKKLGPVEIVDPPSLPESPISPNHYVIALLGLSLGLVSGGVFARVRPRTIA